MDELPLVQTSKNHTPPPPFWLLAKERFYVFVTKQSLQWCGPTGGAPWPWTPQLPLAHSLPIVSLRLRVSGGSMSAPPTSDLTTRAPSIFTCSTPSFHSNWSNPLTSGVAGPRRLKRLFQARPSFYLKDNFPERLRNNLLTLFPRKTGVLISDAQEGSSYCTRWQTAWITAVQLSASQCLAIRLKTQH